jgi:hypothetical protein
MGSWEEHVRRFLLEEEEDDDELFFVILLAIIPYLSEEKRPIHTTSLTGAKKVKEINEGHESWCKSGFRMEKEIFKATSNFLRRENLLCDTRGVSIEEQLGMFMYMISHNASNQMLQKAFQHSGDTIHQKISEVFEIVPILTQRFVKLSSQFKLMLGLQQVLGSCPFSGELQLQTHNYPMLIATSHQHIYIFVPSMQNCLVPLMAHMYPSLSQKTGPLHIEIEKELFHTMLW